MMRAYKYAIAAGLVSFMICAVASVYSYSRYNGYEAAYRYNQNHPVFHGDNRGHVTVSTEAPRKQADHWLRVLEAFVAISAVSALGLMIVLRQERRSRLAGLEQVDR